MVPSPVRPVADRAGFTLIELLVAMVVSGLLVGVIFQLMQGQARYVGTQSSLEEVQQNARAAVELIGSELRSIPPGPGVVTAQEQALTIRVPRVWGVVCATAGSTVWLRVPDMADVSYTPTAATGFTGDTGTGADPWTGAVTVNAVSVDAAGCPAAGGTLVRRLDLAGTPQTSANAPLAAGNRAYLYDQVSYSIGTSAGVDGSWIRREGDGSGAQPFAGPVLSGGAASEQGLRFRYFAGDAELLPPLAASSLPTVSRVEVVVRTISRGPEGTQRQVEHDSILISLRNRS